MIFNFSQYSNEKANQRPPYLNKAPEKNSLNNEFSQSPNVEVSQTAAKTRHHSPETS